MHGNENVHASVCWVTECAGGGLLKLSDIMECYHPQYGTVSNTVQVLYVLTHGSRPASNFNFALDG